MSGVREQPTVRSVLDDVKAFLGDSKMITEEGWLAAEGLLDDIRQLRVEPDDHDDIGD